MKHHDVPIDASELHLTPLHPPRKRFWDLLPIAFREWYLERGWHNPQPTPYEVWIINSAFLRSKFKALRNLVVELAASQVSLQKLIDTMPETYFHTTPDKKKVAPEDLN